MNDGAEAVEHENRTDLNISVQKASEKELDIVTELNEMYKLKDNCEGIVFKKVEFKKLYMAIREINKVLPYFQTSTLSETNNLIIGASVWAARRLALKR